MPEEQALANFLAFASVTATISYLLEEVNRDVPGIKITAKPLDALDLQNPINGLNVFLYYLSPYSALDSIDTLAKDSVGEPANNPFLVLDLHYLITATASENDDFVAQKILASTMRILNEHPVLSRDFIRKAVRNNEGLEASDLADQVEDVKLSLSPLSPEEIARIWSRFPNANFRPSVAYNANIVLLESKVMRPPTRMRTMSLEGINQLKTPRIERVDPLIIEYARDAKLVIIGENLAGAGASVEFENGNLVNEKPETVSEKRIIASIPSDLEPGIVKISVKHFLSTTASMPEYQPEKRATLKSNVTPFVLAPLIVSPREGKVARGSDLVIDFEPSVSASTNVIILLGDNVFPATHVGSIGSKLEPKTKRVKVKIPNNMPKGTYLLRVSIDGAYSLVVTDDNPRSRTFRKAIGPYVEVV